MLSGRAGGLRAGNDVLRESIIESKNISINIVQSLKEKYLAWEVLLRPAEAVGAAEVGWTRTSLSSPAAAAERRSAPAGWPPSSCFAPEAAAECRSLGRRRRRRRRVTTLEGPQSPPPETGTPGKGPEVEAPAA